MPHSIPLRSNVPLAPLTTLGVGGAARWFLDANDENAVRAALEWASEENADIFVLGGGSNLLVHDRGYDGLVLRLTDDGLDVDPGPRPTLRVGGGFDWDALVKRCVTEEWAGLECLSGIPGRVGAAPIQNIGAYGAEIAEVVTEVRCVSMRDGTASNIAASDCGFGYRTSHFKTTWRHERIVTAVTLRLEAQGDPRIRYAELQERVGHDSSLREVREAVLAVRRRKSMVLDPSDPNSRSAGSFFVNPVVSEADADAIAQQVPGGDDMPRYEVAPGQEKLSAAWLIERAGFRRGHVDGAAGLSGNHVLAIINRGEARASDLARLAAHVRRTVHDTFGVTLTPEPVLLGFEPHEAQPLTGTL